MAGSATAAPIAWRPCCAVLAPGQPAKKKRLRRKVEIQNGEKVRAFSFFVCARVAFRSLRLLLSIASDPGGRGGDGRF